MATESKGSALGKLGPTLAPLIGVVVAVIFVVVVIMSGDVGDKRDNLSQQVSRISAQRDAGTVQADTGVFPDLSRLATRRSDAPPRPDATPVRQFGNFPINWDVRIQPATPTDPVNGENGDDVPDFAADFAALDASGNGRLEAPSEITHDQLDAMDYSGNGYVTFEDYRRFRTEGPVPRFNLARPGAVTVATDPNRMESVIRWDDPVAEDLPEDLAYVIERRAPETVAARRAEFRQQIRAHSEAEMAWLAARDQWLNQPHDDGERRRRDAIPSSRWDAEYASASGSPRPQPPVEPSEWELVTQAPVTGNEFRDTSFQLNTTYVYAVRAVTQSRLYRGTEVRTDVVSGYSASDRRTQVGRPVYLQNRISMDYMNVAGQTATIRLTQWLRHQNEGTVTWLRISVEERVNVEQDSELGRNYTLAELQERSVTIRDQGGSEIDVTDVLATDSRVDFRTGFEYRGQAQGNMMLSSRDLGDFALPRATREAATVQTDSAGMANPIEAVIAAIAVNGAEATIVSTRWLAVGDEWYRVVLQQRVSRGAEAGRMVRLGAISDGDNIQVFDSRGEVVRRDVLRGEALRDQEVDLRTGAFEGLTGRVVTIGGSEFDLFGVLYAE
jgi:hypothetical protein